jgi:molybdenum cofactor biosynthesis protein MoaC
MRDVSAKVSSLRTAVAEARLLCSPETIALIREDRAPKGDPRPIAKVAAIQAAKDTPRLIPYCHSVALDWVHVEIHLEETGMRVLVTTKAIDRTGVEMEALTGASVAALNLYDLLKPVDDTMSIEGIRLLEKTGGKSNQPRHAFSCAILVVSDTVAAGVKPDRSGELMRERLVHEGGEVVGISVVPDDQALIAQAVRDCCGQPGIDFVFTTGGTGLGPRDVTPEGVLPLFDRELPGIVDQLMSYGLRRLPLAMLGRPVAGLCGQTIVICLPGSPGAVEDGLNALFPYLTHALGIIRGGGHG